MPSSPSNTGEWLPIREILLEDEIGASIGISGLGFARDRSVLLVADLRGGLRAYNAANWSDPIWMYHHNAPVRSLATSPDGKLAAFADREGDVILIDPMTGRKLIRAPRPVGSDQLARRLGGEISLDRRRREAKTGLTFSPDSQLLAVSSFDKTIELLETSSLQAAGRVGLGGVARAAVFLPDGPVVYVSGDDGAIDAYQIRPEVEALRLSNFERVTVAADGSWIAGADRDQRLWLIDPKTGRASPDESRSSRLVGKPVKQLEATPDGRFVVASAPPRRPRHRP